MAVLIPTHTRRPSDAVLRGMGRRGIPIPPEWSDEPARPRPGSVLVRGHGNASGYGRLAQGIARELERLGQPTAFATLDVPPADPWFAGAGRLAPGAAGPGLQLSSPWSIREHGGAVWSMWESSRLPEASVEVYNRARVVIVPDTWNRRVFLASGVRAPLRIVPLGVDPEAYRPGPARDRPGFTAVSVAAVSGGGHRKGLPELARAFVAALGDRPDARLVLKVSGGDAVEVPDHPGIIVDFGDYTDPELAELYRSADVYASATRGEGWGYPPHEAAACGIPYLGPIHTALDAVHGLAGAYPVAWDPEPARGPFYEGHGAWCVPRFDDLVAKFREAYGDPEGRRRKGEAAARSAARYTIRRSAAGVLEVLREFGLAPAGPASPRVPAPDEARLRLAMRADLCEHGSGPCGCGSGPPRICSRPGRPREVRRADCLACVAADAP